MRSYLAGNDPCLPADLMRQSMPAGLVGTGHGRRDRLTRQLFDAHGVGGELRVLLRDAHGVWGSLALLRSAGGRAFDRTDATRVLALAPVLISALRQYVRSGPVRPVAPDMAPGVFVVDADGKVTGATPMASWWAERLREQHPASWVDALVTGMAAQTRRLLRHPATPAPVMHGPAARFGRWISTEGQLLDPGGAVAVLVRAVPPRQLLGSLGVTSRAELLAALNAWPRATQFQSLGKHLDAACTPTQIHEAVTADVRRAAKLIDTGLTSLKGAAPTR